MKKKWLQASVLFASLMVGFVAYGVQRFPKPEFESGYLTPQTSTPGARAEIFNYIDVLVLFLALSIITWLILKKRSRKGVFWMSIFSLGYFGFYKAGCVCAIGSVQNVTLGLFDSTYHIPLMVIAFFALPLLFALFFGRVFCAGVCPLGALQDIFAFKPMKVKPWIQKALGLIPFIYLGLAILYAATATDFIICRYDPFVGFFRMDATFAMFLAGGILLLVGVLVARPYCRFLCPYAVLLNWCSRVSKKHISITPTECIQCKLCEDSCPFDAIEKPIEAKETETKAKAKRRIILLSLLLPVLIFVGGWTGAQFHENLAMVNPTVRLAEKVQDPQLDEETLPDEVVAFKSAGKTKEQLLSEADSIINKFYTGGWLLGGFLGLVFGLTLWNLSVYKHRTDYTPNRGTCLSCARCVDYCPVMPDNKNNSYGE